MSSCCELNNKDNTASIRFDPDVLDGLKALGRGWQTCVNEVMRKYLETRA